VYTYITHDDNLTNPSHCVDNHKAISLFELKRVVSGLSDFWVNGYT
jgi:hypothetical protein